MRDMGFFRSRPRKRRVEIVVLLLGCVAIGYAFSGPTHQVQSEAIALAEDAAVLPETEQATGRFDHNSAQHSRMPCLLCHKRQEGLFTPKMPGHLPCSGCHVQEFTQTTGPLCNVCHTPTSVKPFPPIRSFNANFNHGKHLRQTNCADCHKPSRRGVALSVPSGPTAHRSCFQCHGPRSEVGGRNIGSCGTCHSPGRPTRATDWARSFAFNFSHNDHLRRSNMNCSSCHTVLAGSGRGRQVTEPTPAMHFPPVGKQSCATCHNGKRSFGIDNFANCKKCHEGRTFKF